MDTASSASEASAAGPENRTWCCCLIQGGCHDRRCDRLAAVQRVRVGRPGPRTGRFACSRQLAEVQTGGVARALSCPVFVGRAEEQARLRAAVAAVGPDRARLVLVVGEAGVGKTRLVADTAAWARERGVTVLDGACLPLGEALPYGPFVEMLGPDMFVGAEATDRLRLFRAVADRLAERAGAAPLLVVVEDLHWADSSTCDLMVFCARVLGAERLVLVGTYRRGEVRPGGALGWLLGS